jgi:SAM-dependent methyltransferase
MKVLEKERKFNHMQFVEDFLTFIGLKECQSNEEFWDQLEENHDEEILDQLEQALIAHNEGLSGSDNLYEVKNQNLVLSLDVSCFSTNLYKKYFEWFIKHSSNNPKRILDLGCDNGIVTCFYGSLFPESEVIGIDIQENSIRCAKELASKLPLRNVSFVKMDFKNIQNHFAKNSFNLITSLRSFHEMVGEFPDDANGHKKDYFLKNIQALLTDDTSEFISCERLPGDDSTAMWVRFLKDAGFYVSETCFIDFHEIGQEQQMPIMVARKHLR